MIFGQMDYGLERIDDKEFIYISKEALERWRDYFQQLNDNLPKDYPSYQFAKGRNFGMKWVLNDILNHFENEEEDE